MTNGEEYKERLEKEIIMNRRKLNILGLVVFLVVQLLIFMPAISKENQIDTLRVALYPYVPSRLSLFQKIEETFEKNNPGINLELVSDSNFLSYYYSGGLQKVSADVYEVDTILLSDMIKLGKIAQIELPTTNFNKEAIDAVTRNGALYGVPHWLCGNFFFYKRGDKDLESASTWLEINNILKRRKEGLFVDFKGKSTLGEWYFTILSELEGIENAQESILEGNTLNPNVVSILTSMIETCPAGFCRSDDLHDRTGYYSRAFMSGKSSAYVGYSESIHYGIQYALDNCIDTYGCLSIKDIAVRRLPPSLKNSKSNGLGWVNAFAIDSKLKGEKKRLANKFIEFMVSEDTYKSILEPDWMVAPSYLIPARINLNIDSGPLYESFYKAHLGRQTGTIEGLNNRLRSIGKKLDCLLPISRTDIKTRESCQP